MRSKYQNFTAPMEQGHTDRCLQQSTQRNTGLFAYRGPNELVTACHPKALDISRFATT